MTRRPYLNSHLCNIFFHRATLIWAVNRLSERFTDKTFYAFAVMRTINKMQDFKKSFDPVIETIILREDENAIRRS